MMRFRTPESRRFSVGARPLLVGNHRNDEQRHDDDWCKVLELAVSQDEPIAAVWTSVDGIKWSRVPHPAQPAMRSARAIEPIEMPDPVRPTTLGGPSPSTDNLHVSGGVEPIRAGRSQGSLGGASVDTVCKRPIGGQIIAVDGDLHFCTHRFP